MNGVYGPNTPGVVIDLQRYFGLPADGDAERRTQDLVTFLLSVEE